MSLKIEIEKRKEGHYVVKLDGRLDTNTAPECEKKIAPLLVAGTKVIAFDMAKLDFISSMGLRLVLSARKALSAHKGRLVLAGLQPQIADVFDMANVLPSTDILETAESGDIFLDAIQRRETMKDMDVDL
ncbi:MAG: STAS domain-containing protein [Kiritimatiellae bacterium]|nr:STAS domain-containing protein [Kiritimatiellia bacterium]